MLDPNRPLTLLRPQSLADFTFHAVSAAVVVPVAILEKHHWWSTVGLAVGLILGAASIRSAVQGSRHLRAAAPAKAGATYETPRRACWRGARGAYLVAGQTLLFTTIQIGNDTTFATFFAAFVAPATIASGLTLRSIILTERNLSAPLAHHAVQGQALTLTDPIYVDVADDLRRSSSQAST